MLPNSITENPAQVTQEYMPVPFDVDGDAEDVTATHPSGSNVVDPDAD